MASGRTASAPAWDPEDPPLRPDEHLPHALEAAAIAVGGLTDRFCRERFGVSPADWRCLVMIAEAEPLDAAAAVARAGADPAIARHALSGLVWRGLARESAGALTLTPEGRALYERISPLALAYEATLVAGLTPGEVAALKLLLRRLRAAAERLRGPSP